MGFENYVNNNKEKMLEKARENEITRDKDLARKLGPETSRTLIQAALALAGEKKFGQGSDAVKDYLERI